MRFTNDLQKGWAKSRSPENHDPSIWPVMRVQLLLVILTMVFIGCLVLLRGGRWRGCAFFLAVLIVCLFVIPSSWYRSVGSVLLDWWDLDKQKTKRLVLIVLAAVLGTTLIVHGFLFTNEFFSHDSVWVVRYTVLPPSYYIRLGRLLIPYYEMLKGDISAPWLIAVLFTLWMFLASILTVRTLRIKAPACIILTCGLLCSNVAMSTTGATFVFCMDDYALALLLAVAAAWCFCRCRRGEVLGCFCLVLSLALYQAYFSTAAVLCFFSLILAVLQGEDAWLVVLRGLRYLGLLAISFCLYFLSWTIACQAIGMEKRRIENTVFGTDLSSTILRVLSSYRDFFQSLLNGKGILGKIYPAVELLVMLLLALWLLGWLRSGGLSKGGKILLALSALMIPAVLNVNHILFTEGVRTLMSFNKGLWGLLPLLCIEHVPCSPRLEGKRLRWSAVMLVMLLLWQNTVYANQAYIKKELQKTTTLSVITRVLSRVETLDGYIPKETKVVFIGSPRENPLLCGHWGNGFAALSSEATLYSEFAVTNHSTITRYIARYLNYPMVMYDETEAPEIAALDEVKAMPVFPYEDSVRFVGDTVVVKLS